MDSLKGSRDRSSKDSSDTQDKQRTRQSNRAPAPQSSSTTIPPRKDQRNIQERQEQYLRQPYQRSLEARGATREHHDVHRRGGSPPRPPYREPRAKAEELKPTPIGTTCTPTCPLFRCDKRALIIKLVDGKPQAFCTWVNDVCIGYRCQYAFCAQRYLLPDGKCAAVLKSGKEEEDSFLKELESSEEEDKLLSLLGKKGLSRDVLY